MGIKIEHKISTSLHVTVEGFIFIRDQYGNWRNTHVQRPASEEEKALLNALLIYNDRCNPETT
jgi:hypothetical protein